MKIHPGFAYLAPANYPLLLENDGKLALSTDVQVNFARPSVDVLFDSAASSLGARVIGVILTGSASDGARGLERICQSGGYTIVQDPDDAKMPGMPQHALQRLAASNVTVRNIITSMRLISDTNWAELFEGVSLVDERLRAASALA